MMANQKQNSAAEAAYAEALGEAERSLPRAGWLEPVRSAGRALVSAGGLPHRRMERWRWTDLRAMLDGAFPPKLGEAGDAAAVDPGNSPFAALDRDVMMFVDGRLHADLSSYEAVASEIEVHTLSGDPESAPDWVRERLGQSYGADDDAVAALNAAFFSDGVALRVPAGTTLEKPLELCFWATASKPQTLFSRLLVVVEEGASATLLECHRGPDGGRYVTNGVAEVHVARSGRLDHVRLQDESGDAVHLGNVHTAIGEDATYNLFTLDAGARVVRNQVFAILEGEGGHVDVSGAYLLGGQQHCDTSLVVDHAVPGCTSNELFKCVMDDRARGIFQGKIIVRPDAQKTDGMQMSQGLLLSETAEFDAKPELEIFADDVRCTHGATSGELDDELMFYLRSRGIPADEAKSLLIAAFVGEAVEQVRNDDVKEILNGFAARGIAGAGGS